MGLMDELLSLSNSQNTCKASEILSNLSKEELEIVNKLLESPDGNVNALARILTKNGHSISSRTLLRHRNRNVPNREGCSCP